MVKKLYFKRNNDKNDNVVIFLHGLYSSSLSFSNLLKLLENDINYIAIDLPSHGKSFKMNLSIEKIANEIISFINSNNLKNVSLIGHSLGGTIALMAAEHITSSRAVAIINTPSEPAHLLLHFKGKRKV